MDFKTHSIQALVLLWISWVSLNHCFVKQEHPQKGEKTCRKFLIQYLAAENCFVLLSIYTACFSQHTLKGMVSQWDAQLLL